MWAYLGSQCPLGPVEAAPAPAASKKRKSSVTHAPVSPLAAPCAVFEKGLATVPQSSQAVLLSLYLEYLQPFRSGPHADYAIQKTLEVATELSSLQPSVDVTTLQCSLLTRPADAVSVATGLTKALPQEPLAWLLLADVLACDSSSTVRDVLTALDGGIKTCSPALALGDADNKKRLEVLWRRKVDVRMSAGDSDAASFKGIEEDFKVCCFSSRKYGGWSVIGCCVSLQAANALGMLVQERKLWNALH